MEWNKSDGARIEIEFDQKVNAIADSTSNTSAFTVTVPEYTYVPDGEIQNVVHGLSSVTNKAGISLTVDLSGGTLTDLQCSNGVLSLGVDE